ncbi:hypothetical protein B1R32_11920 [Abditibacterium utsteinense]|uniref:Uncharacterized protein n=1 Tax=Abditibacterium utsteinense TaxID=1960156 RepID=A0A2S8SQ04_9BACT|nr:hypothetical protein [Abditibacterium utsteinense]PQV62880.1 hypothetical protein B1R32_11920 [Abditibacterium utsteinense]
MESPFSSSSPLSTPSFRPARPKVTPVSFAALIPALFAAVFVGVIYHFVGRFLDLLILFPLAAGAIVGAVLASLAKKNKVRSKFALALMGIFCGLLTYGTREFCDSLYHRSQMIPAYAAQIAGNNAAQQAKVEDKLRARFTPIRYFPMYLEMAAEEGISISSSHDYSGRSANAPITGLGFWGFFILDGLLITGAATAIAWSQAAAPFCEPCDAWYGSEMTVSRLHPDQGDEARRLIESRDFAALGNLRGEGTQEKMHCDLLLSKCNGCGVAKLKVRSTRNKSVKTLWQGDVAPKEVAILEDVRAQWLK